MEKIILRKLTLNISSGVVTSPQGLEIKFCDHALSGRDPEA